MRQAGVRLVSVAIFSWAQLEPRDGEFAFGWLDAVLDRLHAGGVRVALATATASPPPWLNDHHSKPAIFQPPHVRRTGLAAGRRS